ncbi:MAG TPA: MBL fold metallo-hydrolase [Blastocatellia bacterium]|nr:MBL fold metallo-hydrolase [Blastocatellia bacterium]
MPGSVSIEILNHASIIVQSGDVRLLCDPWLEGTCFRGAWGLRYRNPAAMEKSSACTHLWISHFHTDHMHTPTLRKIAGQSPDMGVLANVSANFTMEDPMRAAGFKHLTPIYERRQLSLAEQFEVTRYPAAGIDNMLLIRAGGLTILNYNDCTLPKRAIESLMRKIGRVDVLMLNYNIANKAFEHSSKEEVKEQRRKKFQTIVEAVAPMYVIPFASVHYFRSPSGSHQNESFLELEDLAGVVPQLLPLSVGDSVEFGLDKQPVVNRMTPPIPRAPFEVRQHKAPVSWADLLAAAERYRSKLIGGFGPLAWCIPSVSFHVEDLDRVFGIDIVRGVSEREVKQASIDASAHSEVLFDLLGRPYGTDAFMVGADWALLTDNPARLRLFLLAGVLLENRLAPRDLLRMLVSPAGWKFFINRREEIKWVLLGRKFTFDFRL